MKEYILGGLKILCRGISIMSLSLTRKMLRCLGIVIIEENEVYEDNP